MRSPIRISLIFAALFALWLMLSGHFTAWQIFLGLISCGGVTWLTLRMGLRQPGAPALRLRWATFDYAGWLLREIFLSNLKVAGIILNPKLPIRPAVFWAPARQTSDAGRVIFANSITLTPGTISVDVSADGKMILVHALHEAMAWGDEGCEMGARVFALEKTMMQETA